MALKLGFFAPHDEAIARIKGKPAIAREVFDGLLPELRARAFTVTGIEAATVLQRIRDEIAALPAGATWDEVKANVADALPFGQEAAERRAELLLRTHAFQAFQAATWRVAQADDDTTHLQYLTMEDDRVRPSHAALDGLILPKDDPFWDDHMPPWDWGCRCRVRPLNPDLVEQTRREDAGKPPEAQRVLEGPALEQLRHGTLITPDGQRVDVTPPTKRPGGADAFQWHPNNLAIPLDQLRQRYDPAVWAVFETWARATEVQPGQSLWAALEKPPPIPQPKPVKPAPAAPPPTKPPAQPKPAASPTPQRDALVQKLVQQGGVSSGIIEAAKKLPEKAAAELKSSTLVFIKTNRGLYYHTSGQISLDKDPNSWGGRPLTYLHEAGHHLHYKTNIITRSYVDPNFLAAFEADAKLLRRTLLAGAGRKAWATRRDSWFAASGLYGNPTDPDRQKLAGAFADTICALTRGQYGYGHSRAYLGRANHEFMEAYANAFSMVQAKDPIYASHFPNLTKFIQQQFSTP